MVLQKLKDQIIKLHGSVTAFVMLFRVQMNGETKGIRFVPTSSQQVAQAYIQDAAAIATTDATATPDEGLVDVMSELADQLNLFRIAQRSTKKPPSTYLCHLCFQKGHFIKDCPMVGHFSLITKFNAIIYWSSC